MEASGKKIIIDEPVAQAEFEIEILGCYSLPEAWKPGENETQEYTYQVSFLGIQVNNGRTRKRELTEEEIKAAEEAKKGKKEPPKKKGPEAEAELLEEKKKNEELTRRGSQSSRYDDETLFFMTKEDIYKHPCITWEAENPSDARQFKTYPVSIQIEEMKLLELLDCLEDSGAYLDFARVPKTVEEESKKKPVKGKQQEEAKSSYYKAWINLSPFKEYGIVEQHLRVKLEDIEGDELSHTKTYLSIKLKFSTALFPAPSLNSTKPQDIIPIKPPPPKFLPSKDGTHDFQRQIKLACRAISAEYHNTYAEQLSETGHSLQRQKELKEIRRDEFLYYFNTSGKSQILKNKLRKSVVKICREKYKSVNSLKGLSFSEKDKIYSELYAYLLSRMQESIAEISQEKREILHEEPILPANLAEKEKQDDIADILGESYEAKLLRLALECEFKNDQIKACKYLTERTEKNPLSKQVWLDFTKYMLRQYNLPGAEKYMSEVISLSEDWTKEEYMLIACVYLSRKKYYEALVYFNSIIARDPEDILVILLLSINYSFLNKGPLEKYFLAKAKRLCMKHLGLAGPKNKQIEGLNEILLRYDEGKALTQDTLDDLNFTLVVYLINEKLCDLARLCLSRIVNKESSSIKFLYYSAEVEYWSHQYDQAIIYLDEVLKLEPRHHLALTLKADSCFNSNNFDEAQECYLKSIRYSKSSSSNLLIKLGNIYLKKSAWAGAKLLFSKCCEEQTNSIAWEGLGIACLNLSELDIAEQALTHANLMNDENPYVWASLAYLCLKQTQEPPGRYYQFRQCLTQAFRLGIKDPHILRNIGNEYTRKFFLNGTGPNSQRLDVSEVKIIYIQAKMCGADEEELRGNIEREFESIKDLGNNRLDQNLIDKIESAKIEVVNAVR
ncbi:hypothetical protein SteCoe_3805 [Stentor coeruleus]|uniref:Uncharacterized protein n=1 Tax=Stentor coeruleus TaxID=5963 RepID=A0A1R2CW67_9CILI|nr:hypothetical protein SteCoe_3805 [Stentor coeruleus]